MITGPVLCACFRAVFVSRVRLFHRHCVACCVSCGLLEAPQSARSPARPADHAETPNVSALCGGVLFSYLRVHAGELLRVTNVVNPSNFLYVFLSDCYKRRQSSRYFSKNRMFWAWFDDVCNRTPHCAVENAPI